MIITEVQSIFQSALAQTFGEGYQYVTGVGEDGAPIYETVGDGKIANIAPEKLVDIGKDITDTTATTEKFMNSISSILGKREIITRDYNAEIRGILVNTLDWGGYVERTVLSPAEIVEDDMFNLVDGQSYDDHVFHKPKAFSKIFNEGKTVQCVYSTTRSILFESFRSWDGIDNLLSKIASNARRTINIAIHRIQHLLVSAGFAIASEATGHNIHILSEFNTATGNSCSVDDVLNNPTYKRSFGIFLSERISQIKDYMRVPSTSFNNGNVPLETPDSDCNVLLLSDIARKLKFSVKADTYHPEAVGFGDFETISYWQAHKEDFTIEAESEEEEDETVTRDFTFETLSKIKFSADATNKLGIGTDAVELDNCIGLIYDKYAIGMTLDKEKTTSSYTARADFWNTYIHKIINMIIDSNFNMVAITLD